MHRSLFRAVSQQYRFPVARHLLASSAATHPSSSSSFCFLHRSIAPTATARPFSTTPSSSPPPASSSFGHLHPPPPILLNSDKSHEIPVGPDLSSLAASSHPFELTFLGTASGRPTPTRNTSSLALRIGDSSRNGKASSSRRGGIAVRIRQSKLILIDTGDGTQRRMLSARHLDLSTLAIVCITHMHGDHVSGLPSLLTSACNHSHAPSHPLHIFGPVGIAQYIKMNLSATHTWLERPIVYHELCKHTQRVSSLPDIPDVMYHQNTDFSPSAMQVYEDNDIIVSAGSLKHRDLSCWGYVFEEKLHSTSPSSSSSAASSSSTSSTSPSSSTPYHPRKLVVLGDTCDSITLLGAGQNADVLVHEATYLDTEDMQQKVHQAGHSTAKMAGGFAFEIAARHLILTHFSQRYLKNELSTGEVDMNAIQQHVEEAKNELKHERVYAAQDLAIFHVARRRRKEKEIENEDVKTTITNNRSSPTVVVSSSSSSSSISRSSSLPSQDKLAMNKTIVKPSTASASSSPRSLVAATSPHAPLRIVQPRRGSN